MERVTVHLPFFPPSIVCFPFAFRSRNFPCLLRFMSLKRPDQLVQLGTTNPCQQTQHICDSYLLQTLHIPQDISLLVLPSFSGFIPSERSPENTSMYSRSPAWLASHIGVVRMKERKFFFDFPFRRASRKMIILSSSPSQAQQMTLVTSPGFSFLENVSASFSLFPSRSVTGSSVPSSSSSFVILPPPPPPPPPPPRTFDGSGRGRLLQYYVRIVLPLAPPG